MIKSTAPDPNFANVIGGHLMRITRYLGKRIFEQHTPKYNLLCEAFGWKIPEYIHLTPMREGRNAEAFEAARDAHFDDFIRKGYLSEAIINYAFVGLESQRHAGEVHA